MKLVLATRNKGKIQEIRDVLADLGIQLSSLDDCGSVAELIEKGGTLEENAMHKALTVARQLRLPALADDSGLEVDHLKGGPGVFSSRFAGDGASDEENNEKLLEALKGVPAQKRGAAFRCVMVLAMPDGRFWTAEGRCEGRIAEVPTGTGGFGYDPLFFVPELGKTFAELRPEVKNRISHRAKALIKIRRILGKIHDCS
ncbi:MAG TPA: XTP/dITP diphosphatase [Candidatus Latescibacteria bacterium]|nr:XTP/dITP diphosphatase [Candidatus Latescibacterota bacterium]